MEQVKDFSEPHSTTIQTRHGVRWTQGEDLEWIDLRLMAVHLYGVLWTHDTSVEWHAEEGAVSYVASYAADEKEKGTSSESEDDTETLGDRLRRKLGQQKSVPGSSQPLHVTVPRDCEM